MNSRHEVTADTVTIPAEVHVEIPVEYHGREQTWLKHQVLKKYLAAWGQKMASVGRRLPMGQRLWFVDCFAGPWGNRDPEGRDTSIAIGLDAMNAAAERWGSTGAEVHAIFVEENRASFAKLQRLLASNARAVQAVALPGSFGDNTAEIQKRIGGDAAFLFIDPTGWKGVAMDFIAPLARRPRRDVMVNVMFDHINRFKDDPREFLRDQMRDFFGEDLQPGLSEEGLMEVYRRRLKERCTFRYTADIAVPVPTKNRTKFRLVVGGHHHEVLRLFRDVECDVMGKAGEVLGQARDRDRQQRTRQEFLFSTPAPSEEPIYADMRESGCEGLRAALTEVLAIGPRRFVEVWPDLLERRHVTVSDVERCLRCLVDEGIVAVEGRGPRQRKIEDRHLVRWVGQFPDR